MSKDDLELAESLRNNSNNKLVELDGKGNVVDSNKVDHPAHYNRGKIEVIDFIEDQRLGFHLGSAVKYLCREENKHSIRDLEAAVWYIQREIDRRNGTLVTTTERNFGTQVQLLDKRSKRRGKN